MSIAALALGLRHWYASKVPELSDELDDVGQARQIEQAISGGD